MNSKVSEKDEDLSDRKQKKLKVCVYIYIFIYLFIYLRLYTTIFHNSE